MRCFRASRKVYSSAHSEHVGSIRGLPMGTMSFHVRSTWCARSISFMTVNEPPIGSSSKIPGLSRTKGFKGQPASSNGVLSQESSFRNMIFRWFVPMDFHIVLRLNVIFPRTEPGHFQHTASGVALFFVFWASFGDRQYGTH